jgi:predicted NBD/HSP70 family sugar kinase
MNSMHFSGRNHTNRDIRQANRLRIVRQLLLGKTSTRQELSQLTGLSTATVASLVASMLKEGLLVETGFEPPQLGRPTAVLRLNASAGVCAGVEMVETYIRFVLYDLGLDQLAKHQVELPTTKKEPLEIVQVIVSGLDTMLAQAGMPPEKVVGVGISIAGPFEHSSGVTIFDPTWRWVDVPLQSMLEQELSFPLYLDNPLKFNAITEARFGSGRDIQTLIAVVLGSGVGAGLVINGQLFHGSSNTAGEWGHSVVVAGGRTCRCGNRGCVEAYAGAPGILETLAEIDPHSSLLFPDDHERSIAAIAAAAGQGDPIAMFVVQQTAVYLSAGLSSLVNVLNPERVILGSWVAAALGPVMLPTLIKLVEQQSLARPFKAVQFVLSDMPSDTVTLGAATLVLEKFLSNSRH